MMVKQMNIQYMILSDHCYTVKNGDGWNTTPSPNYSIEITN